MHACIHACVCTHVCIEDRTHSGHAHSCACMHRYTHEPQQADSSFASSRLSGIPGIPLSFMTTHSSTAACVSAAPGVASAKTTGSARLLSDESFWRYWPE